VEHASAEQALQALRRRVELALIVGPDRQVEAGLEEPLLAAGQAILQLLDILEGRARAGGTRR